MPDKTTDTRLTVVERARAMMSGILGTSVVARLTAADLEPLIEPLQALDRLAGTHKFMTAAERKAEQQRDASPYVRLAASDNTIGDLRDELLAKVLERARAQARLMIRARGLDAQAATRFRCELAESLSLALALAREG